MDTEMQNICWTPNWADNGLKILEVKKNQLYKVCCLGISHLQTCGLQKIEFILIF